MNWPNLFGPWHSERLCLTLVHSFWQVALLGFVVWAVDRIWRRKSVEWSYSLHVAALVLAVVALPLTYASVRSSKSHDTAIASAPAILVSPGIKESPGRLPGPNDEVRPAKAPVLAVDVGRMPQSAVSAKAATSNVWFAVSRWLTGIYVAGVLIMFARLAAGFIRAERLRKLASPMTQGPLVETLQRLSKKWSLHVAPVLATADDIVVPKVVGLMRPMILLPMSALSSFSVGELELILTHELAHVRRYDMWVNLLQRLAEVVLFFNPALWYLSRRTSSLREYCCDEMACRDGSVASSNLRADYAAALLRIVELSNKNAIQTGQIAALAASGRSPSELRRRVARLFGEPLSEPLPFSRSGLAVLAVAFALFLCGPMVWPSRAQNSDDAPKSAPPTKSATASEAKDTAPTSKVEVLAIGTHRETPQRWWDAQGKPIETLPFTWKDREKNVASPDTKWRRIVMRVKDLPADGDVRWEIPHSSSWTGVAIGTKDDPNARGYYGRFFAMKDDAKNVSLRVGIASGPWKLITKLGNGDIQAINVRNKNIVASEPYATKNGTVIVVSHDFFDEEYRVVAIDKQGKTHTSVSTGGASAGKISQTQPTFPGLTIDTIDHFEFQVRDYQWIEVKDVPLNPADSGAAKTSKSTPTANARFVASVVDAETGKPIPKFLALAGSTPLEGAGWQWQPHMAHEFSDGQMQWPPPGSRGYDMQALRIEADGYAPFQTQPIKQLSAGEIPVPAGATDDGKGHPIPRIISVRPGDPPFEMEIRLWPDKGVVGRVLLPSGEPAAGAEVAIGMANDQIVHLENGKISFSGLGGLRRRWPTAYRMTTTDKDGRFKLPSEIQTAAVVVAHPSGVAVLSYQEFQQSPVIQLKAWGRIEGQVQWGEKSGIGEKVSLHAHGGKPTKDFQPTYMVSVFQDAKADANGRFTFDHVPPGNAQVDCREATQFVAVSAGTPTKFVFGGHGRQVIGKLVGRDSWENIRIRIAPNAPWPGFLGSKDGDDILKKYGEFLESDAGKNYVKDDVPVQADGSFRVENVPPEYYQLFVSVETDGKPGPNIGGTSFDVKTVLNGPGNEPQDLGVLDVAPHDRPKAATASSN